MSLNSLTLPHSCRTDTHALGVEVLGAALRNSRRYDRAAGYFSSSLFSASSAFLSFFLDGGEMRLICSPILSGADIAAVHRAYVNRSAALADLANVSDLLRQGSVARVFAAWLASGKLLMQIAIPEASYGMYHEKIGIFSDRDMNFLAFSGSANESRTAWTVNFERVDLFPSWTSPESKQRCNRVNQAFQELWHNQTSGLQILSVHEAFLMNLLQRRNGIAFDEGAASDDQTPVPSPPPEMLAPPPAVQLFSHQEAAIQAWGQAGGKGILEMATGTGKTITALMLASRLFNALGALVVVIIAPMIHLVDQWIDNARRFGLRPIRIAEKAMYWQEDLAVAINSVNAGHRPVLSIVSTQYSMESSTYLSDHLKCIRRPILFIGDEVHNYHGLAVLAAIPTQAKYRLGLSATPLRYGDPEGSARIQHHFGPVVFRFGLNDAITNEILTPYRYFPVRVELCPDELQEYMALSSQLARYPNDPESDTNESVAFKLLMKRARLLGGARRKMEALRSILETRKSDTHILVYCGDGQVDGAIPNEQMRQLDAVLGLIGNELGMKCASFTSVTSPERRKVLLEQFATGQIQVMVAIRCLDEGIDIPSTRTAIMMASSVNPRQFVQRRGRILRRSPNKSRAELFDLLICPDVVEISGDSLEHRAIRRILTAEFRRAAEFAMLASNGPVARRSLNDITEQLQLHSAWYTQNQVGEEDVQ